MPWRQQLMTHILFSSPRRKNSLQSNTEIQDQVRLKVIVRLIAADGRYRSGVHLRRGTPARGVLEVASGVLCPKSSARCIIVAEPLLANRGVCMGRHFRLEE